jgi:hypothetical protein
MLPVSSRAGTLAEARPTQDGGAAVPEAAAQALDILHGAQPASITPCLAAAG